MQLYSAAVSSAAGSAASSAAGSAAARLRGCSSLFVSHFRQNLHRHVRGDFAVQLDGHLEVAKRLQRLAQLDLAAIDLKALRLRAQRQYRTR